tara:strand:- start:723 stop:1121 length:399 start_codon:yes stop_codon:yes gene_type:complete
MVGTIERFYATGKRKESIAKVWVQAGSGEIIVNNKSLKEYFCRESLECIVKHPLVATDTLGSVNIKATVKGGGLSGQSGALRLGISRALILTNSSLRGPLKKAGFLTRDSRSVERKKYGQPGARKKFQFSKR